MALSERDTDVALNRIRQKAQQRAYNVARYTLKRIRANAPVDTTELRESYYIEKDPETGDWLIKSTARYWQFVEYGTKEHGNAQPHVRPAIDEARARYGVD